MMYPSSLGLSRIQDHNRFPDTDVLYEPLRKVLLRPGEVAQDRQFLNPAASQSRVTRDFAYLNENEVRNMRDQILIPVDQPLVPTHNLEKVRNNRFMVVDAKQYSVGTPISVQEMQRIKNQGLKEQRIVYDFGRREMQINQQVRPIQIIQPSQPITNVRPPQPVKPVQPQVTVIQQQVQPIIRKTKVIKQQPKTSYIPPTISQNQYKTKDKYKYNLYSMLDQQVNGGGCGCPSNEIIASRNEPQSINWLG